MAPSWRTPLSAGGHDGRYQQRNGVSRCACRSPETGQQLGAQCPQRGQPGHGRWYYDAHVPGPDGRQKRLRQGGFTTRAAAEQGLVEVLRSALSEARRQGLVSTNVAWRLRLPRGGRPQAVAWTREREKLWWTTGARPPVAVWEVEHVAEFLEAVQDDPLFPLWWLIALRGLRRGEAVAVRGVDLDERYRELSVKRQLLVIDGKVHLGPPKSAAGVRTLALDEFTNQLLHRQKRTQQRRFAGTGANPHGYLFTHPDGRPLRPDWLSHRFRALVRELGLPPVRLHDLRHGAASLAGAAGVELKVIQHDLGHSSAVTTADTYWTVFRELAHGAVAATAELLRSHARFRLNLGPASQA